ncbi:MAG: aldo/keto reductase, partial [Planctomycetota bacterium]
QAEEVLLPKAQQHGIGVIVRIPLLFGLLTGKFTRRSIFGADDHRRMNLSPENLEKYLAELEALQPVFDHCPGQTLAQISLRFCLSHPACQTTIPGAKTPKQVRENSAASDAGELPTEALRLLP